MDLLAHDSLTLGSSMAVAAQKAPGTYDEELHGLAPELEARGGGSSLQRQEGWQKPLLLCGALLLHSQPAEAAPNLRTPPTTNVAPSLV